MANNNTVQRHSAERMPARYIVPATPSPVQVHVGLLLLQQLGRGMRH